MPIFRHPEGSTSAALPGSLGFHAMPDSPYIIPTHCGYSQILLKDLGITSDQVAAVFVDAVEVKWRPVLADSIMVIPAFPLEANRVVIELKVPAGNTAPETFKPVRVTLPPPKESWGFTAPETRREAAQ